MPKGYLTTKELMVYLSCCRQKAEKTGVQAGAKCQIGRSVRWNIKKIDAFLEKGGNE